MQPDAMGMTALDKIACDPRYSPYWGWHDDHRWHDRSPDYKPALQQNRAEIHQFVQMLVDLELGSKCLQLGLGNSGAAHALWQYQFEKVWSVDNVTANGQRMVDELGIEPFELVWANTHDPRVYEVLRNLGAYDIDLLFIDAGHLCDDVKTDYTMYAHLVRPGGIIAFHDAVKRPTYEEEIQVWRFIEELQQNRLVHVIGHEIGIAWMMAGQ